MREPLSKRTKSRSLTKSANRSAAAPKKAAPKGAKLKVVKPSAVAAIKPKTVKGAKAAPARAEKATATKAKLGAKAGAGAGAIAGAKRQAKPAPKLPVKSAIKAAVAVKTTAKGAVKSAVKVAAKAAAKSAARNAQLPLPPVVQHVVAPPEPLRRQPSSGGLRAFEQALKVFNRRQFAEAKELFEALHTRFPHEVEINARAQTYIQICNQKIPRPNASPRDADELYDRGVIALNVGDFMQARALFEKALRLRPNEPHLLYSLAATHAQTGAHDQALDYLNRSIQIQPRYRAQAMNDNDFSELHEDKRFLEILGVSSPFDLLEARR